MATTADKESLVKPEHYVYAHTTKIPGVCGGKATIDGRRVRVMDIVILHQDDYTPEEMLEEYDFLNLAQIPRRTFLLLRKPRGNRRPAENG